MALTVSGETSDFANTTSLVEKIAEVAGVPADQVCMTVAAGSVVLSSQLTVVPPMSATVVQQKLAAQLGTAELASAVLGIAVESDPVIDGAPLPPPMPPCETGDECECTLWKLKYTDTGLDAQTVAQLTSMAETLCGEIEPCPTEPPTCDPHNLCTTCGGVTGVEQAAMPSSSLQACIASINWACCTPERCGSTPAQHSDLDTGGCYQSICKGVPEAGWTLASVTAAQLSTVSAWQSTSCASSQASVLAKQASAALRSVQQAEGKASLSLLAVEPNSAAHASAARAGLAAVSALRRQLAAKSCDEALRSSAHELLASLVGGGERRKQLTAGERRQLAASMARLAGVTRLRGALKVGTGVLAPS